MDTPAAQKMSSGSGVDGLDSPRSLESFDQKMRDIRLAIEYKYLIKHAPGGVYMLPELDNIRKLHGVVFVRRGLWRNGVFRFLVVLPENYNTSGSFPHVFFTPPIFNPLVHPLTGKLDITLDDRILGEWSHDKHFLHTVAMAIKKIFYIKNFNIYPAAANEEAKALIESDKSTFLTKVEKCVQQSLRLAEADQSDSSSTQHGPKCTLIFTEPKPAHEILLEQIMRRETGVANDKTNENPYTGNDSTGSGYEGDRAKRSSEYYDETEALEDGVGRVDADDIEL